MSAKKYNSCSPSSITNFIVGGLLFIALTGCQGFQPKLPGELAMQDQDFLGIWDAYNHCMVGSDIQQMQGNLQILHSAPKPISLDDSPIPVPSFLKRWSSARSSRLAVDPRAMAASCSIHLAEVAQLSADWYTAFITFQSILDNYPEPQYAFYVTKANQAIEQFSSVRPVILFSQEALVR
jgi:hypothetical protein